MPARTLRVIQLASTGEATFGTTGAATFKLMAVTDASLVIKDKVEVVVNIGNLGPGPVAAELQQSGEAKVEAIATYEDLPRLYNGLMTAVAASTGNSTGGAGAAYVYNWTAPVTSTQAVYTYPMEYGTSGAAYRAFGNVVQKLNIKGEAGHLWHYTVDAVCKQVVPATGALTSIADRAVNPVRMADTTLYVDAFSTGTIGGTSVANTLISFDLNIDTKRHLKQFAGALSPTDWGEGKWGGTLATVMEFNASAKAYVDALLGGTGAIVQRQIRIQGTQGSSATTKTATIDFAGVKIDGEKLFEDREGNITVAIKWEGQYSTGLANWLAVGITNGSSSTT